MLRVSFNNVFISFTTNNNKKHIKKGRPNGNNNNNFYTGNFLQLQHNGKERKTRYKLRTWVRMELLLLRSLQS